MADNEFSWSSPSTLGQLRLPECLRSMQGKVLKDTEKGTSHGYKFTG